MTIEMMDGLTKTLRLFLHFFDIHFLDEKGLFSGNRTFQKNLKDECKLAMRFSILSAENVFIPAASFFESKFCFDVVSEFQDLYQTNQIQLVGGGHTIPEFIEDKIQQYRRSSDQYKRYKDALERIRNHPPFYPRKRSSTKDIKSGWNGILTNNTVGKIWAGTGLVPTGDFEKNWEQVPDRLGSDAFILEYVEPLLFTSDINNTIRNRLHAIINQEYFHSYVRELAAGVVEDLSYLAAGWEIPSYDHGIPFKTLANNARKTGLIEKIVNSKGQGLIDIRSTAEWKMCLQSSRVEFARRDEVMKRQIIAKQQSKLDSAIVGVVTALPKEFAAVCTVLGCNESVSISGRGAGRRFKLGKLRNEFGNEITVAVALLTDMANNSAAVFATRLLEHCQNVKHVIMCGIAGAIPHPQSPEDHVRLGDIVVCNKHGVIQYDNLKIEPEINKDRYPPRPPSSVILEAIKHIEADILQGNTPWLGEIDDAIRILGTDWQRPSPEFDILDDKGSGNPTNHPQTDGRVEGEPFIFSGPIASANILLKDPKYRDRLRDKFGVKAVEMEGSGIADATWNFDEVGYSVIRGTCDYCNPDKGDDWQNYAAIIAAAFTKIVLVRSNF